MHDARYAAGRLSHAAGQNAMQDRTDRHGLARRVPATAACCPRPAAPIVWCLALLLLMGIVPAQAAAAQEERHPDAIPIFHCPFDDSWDMNFDRWPDGWRRKRGVEYPQFVEVQLTEDEHAVAERCLEVKVDGAAVAVLSPAIPVDSRFSFVLESQLKIQGLQHSRVFFRVAFFDADDKLLEEVTSRKYRATDGWISSRVGPFSPRHDEVKSALVQLHVEPGEQLDLSGSVRFDDIWFARLPRMRVISNSKHNVYTDPDDVLITATLSGIIERDPEIKFELLEASGGAVASVAKVIQGEVIAEKSSLASKLLGGDPDAPTGYAGSTTWRPPLTRDENQENAYGFYQVRVKMLSPSGIMHERRMTFAVVRSLPKPQAGEFGWWLPDRGRPLSLDSLLDLLPSVGINWLKYPVWYSELDEGAGERIMRFAERLGSKGIELVGVLDRPPAETEEQLGKEHLSAANIFSADPSLWMPSLDPILTRLSLKIRWWQLGDDHDTSFVGYVNLPEKIAELKKQLFRFGQDVQLGIGWKWLAEVPQPEHAPWSFLSMSADPPLTGTELQRYLEAQFAPGVQRWVLVEPLRRSEYSTVVRARDLVDQMIAAKRSGADRIILPDPVNSETGLMNDDGTPGELLLPWRTTALLLAGARYVGSLRLPGNSENHVFIRGQEAVLVVRNDRPTEEVIYLGDDVQQVDIWGRSVRPELREHRQVIEVGRLPTFLVGISPHIARWRLSVQLDKQRIPSVFGTAHRNALRWKNGFGQGVGGELRLVAPGEWDTFPPRLSFKMAAGEEFAKPFEIELPFTASSGRHQVRIDFDVNGDRRYRFSVYRELEVGLGDVNIEVSTRLTADHLLIVEQRMVNHSDKLVDFKCMLHAPGRRRQSNQVVRLGREPDVKRYIYTDGQELIGERLWLRAEELGGLRILNHRFEATE